MSLSGKDHPRWRGGEYIDKQGYRLIWVAPNTYLYEHRLVMERELGRALLPDECVHHRNKDRLDNRPENLQAYFRADHTKHHWDEGGLDAFGLPSRPAAECHPSRPHYAVGLCKFCYCAAAQRDYRANNPEKIKQQNAEYRRQHRARLNLMKRKRRVMGMS